MKLDSPNIAVRGFGIGNAERCVLCGKVPGKHAGYIPRPVDRRPAGVRCGWCYRRYLKKYFPEALA